MVKPMSGWTWCVRRKWITPWQHKWYWQTYTLDLDFILVMGIPSVTQHGVSFKSWSQYLFWTHIEESGCHLFGNYSHLDVTRDQTQPLSLGTFFFMWVMVMLYRSKAHTLSLVDADHTLWETFKDLRPEGNWASMDSLILPSPLDPLHRTTKWNL